MRRRRWLTGLLSAAAVGCHRGRGSTRPEGYPGTLIPSQDLPGAFMARQRVTAHHRRRTTGFEGILQVADGELLLVGLTPFGTKAFTLRQVGLDVDLQTHVPIDLPFAPRDVLLDVHRTLFIGVPGPPLSDGTHEAQRDEEHIIERWQEGRLRHRIFTRAGLRGAISIGYGQGMIPGRPPERAELHNGWFDYRLVIETLELTLLSGPAAAPGGGSGLPSPAPVE